MEAALLRINQPEYSLHLDNVNIIKKGRSSRITSSQLGFLTFSKTHVDKIKDARYMLKLDRKVFTEEELERMRVGTEYEDNVRQYISKRENKNIYKVGVFINREYPFLSGAPDGIMDDGTIIEIKITTKDVPDFYTDDFSEIPIYYLHQMYFNMYNMGAYDCLFIMFSRESGKLYTRLVPFNYERFKTEVLSPCISFYENYMIPLIIENNLSCPYKSYEELTKN